MLDSLFDPKKTGLPIVTLLFLSGCLIVSLPTLFLPDLYEIFGGYKPLNYPWQKWTIAFEHGFYGFPLIVHLLGNGILLWLCGSFCEKLLGTSRFFLLTLTAMLGFALTHSLPFIDGHGASGVIWAYPPVMFIAMRTYSSMDKASAGSDPGIQKIKMLLVIMWIVISVFMAIIPYFAGWRGNPLTSLFLANTFHISATIVGFVFGLLWRGHIAAKLKEMNASVLPQQPGTQLDILAIVGASLIPISLTILLLLIALGVITYPSSI